MNENLIWRKLNNNDCNIVKNTGKFNKENC